MGGWRLTVCLLGLMVPVAIAGAQSVLGPPATMPATTGPAVDAHRQVQLQQWFDQLSDPDAATRVSARFSLLQMSIDELDVFKQIVMKTAHLQPSQAIVLRGIVMHVYLAHQPYPADKTVGMMGVRAIDLRPLGNAPGYDQQPDDDQGPVVLGLLPGFCGYGTLLEGDRLIATRDPAIPIHHFSDLAEMVKTRRAGDKLQLDVLRQGTLVQVNMVLDPRPVAATSQEMEEFVIRRQQEGLTRFSQWIAPMLNQGQTWDWSVDGMEESPYSGQTILRR